MKPIYKFAFMCAIASGLAACSTTSSYKPEYVTASGVAAGTVSGTSVFVMSSSARTEVYSGHPRSFTGAATTLTLPIGSITQEIGKTVLTPLFTGGLTVSDHAAPNAYAISAQVQDFSYEYDQLSNMGFAITPKVSFKLDAHLTDPSGKTLIQHTYQVTDFKADSYVASLKGGERVSEAFHRALADLYRQFAQDIQGVKTAP